MNDIGDENLSLKPWINDNRDRLLDLFNDYNDCIHSVFFYKPYVFFPKWFGMWNGHFLLILQSFSIDLTAFAWVKSQSMHLCFEIILSPPYQMWVYFFVLWVLQTTVDKLNSQLILFLMPICRNTTRNYQKSSMWSKNVWIFRYNSHFQMQIHFRQNSVK